MHEAAFTFVRTALEKAAPLPGLTLEIGSRDINGGVKPLFAQRGDYLGIDVVEGRGVDVVADGATYEPPKPPTCVVCCEVLEHTPDAEAICRQAYHILAPGGVFILTAAGVGRAPHSAVDGGEMRPGEYYANVEADALKHWLDAFHDVTITENPTTHDIYAVARKATRRGLW